MINFFNNKNFAVIVSGIDEEYQYNVICGINKFAKEKNINLSYFAAFGGMLESKKSDIGEYSIYNLIDFSKFDGVILMTNTISDPHVKETIIRNVMDTDIPAIVFALAEPENIVRVLQGEKLGTTVTK